MTDHDWMFLRAVGDGSELEWRCRNCGLETRSRILSPSRTGLRLGGHPET